MTKEQLEHANSMNSKIRAAQYLIVNGNIEPGNFNYLFNNDSDFRQEFNDLNNKYYDKYCELFKSL